MTKLYLILSILLVLIIDVIISVIVVKYRNPKEDFWKIPIWICVTAIIITLSIITSLRESNTYWKALLLIPSIAFAYMALKNMILGTIWHKNPFYLGKKGFDAWIEQYAQNGELLTFFLGIAILVTSGLWRYVKETYKIKY